MSINFGAGAGARLNLSAAPPCNSNDSWSQFLWFKRTQDQAVSQFLSVLHRDTTDGTGVQLENYVGADGMLKWSGHDILDATLDVWRAICIVQVAASNLQVYYATDGGTSFTSSGDKGGNGNAHAINYISLGRHLLDLNHAYSSMCCYRFWPFSLSEAQRNAELISASAATAGWTADWRMATAAGAPQFANVGHSLTIYGTPTTDTDEPSNIASAVTYRSKFAGPFGGPLRRFY